MTRQQGIVETRLIIKVLIFFPLGLLLAKKVEFHNRHAVIWWLGVTIPLLYYKFYKLSKLSLMILFLLLGLWRGTNFMNSLRIYDSLLKHKITIIAKAKNDAVYAKNSQLEFEVTNVRVVEPVNKSLIGTIMVRGYGVPMVNKGDEVQVSAKIFTTRGSKQAVMSFSKIWIIQKDNSTVNNFRRKFSTGIYSTIPEPLGSFGLGLLIGQRTTLPEELNQQLSKVGLMHIVAVSGYNLTIIIQFVLRLFRNRSKFQTTVVTALFIGLFLLITGFSASIVRASVVSLLSIWAWFYGRKFRAVVLLLLSACLTAGYYPIYIWSDIGWHLSFLAFFGILFFSQVINYRFYKNKQPKVIRQLIIETLSAQVMTLPLILYIFGKLSLVAVLANILVVPIVSIAMGLCLIVGIIGILVPHIAGWFTLPVVFVLNYMLDVTKLVSQIPFSNLDVRFTFLQTVFCYLIIIFVSFVWWNKLSIGDKIKI